MKHAGAVQTYMWASFGVELWEIRSSNIIDWPHPHKKDIKLCRTHVTKNNVKMHRVEQGMKALTY